jgi:DNA-binding HxlR family transcriptional regulator
VDSFSLNKSIEVTLRMQVVLVNKSIGVRLLNFSIEFGDLNICSPVLTMLPTQTVGSINSAETDVHLRETLLHASLEFCGMSTSNDTPGDLESVRERLNVITQETRFALLQDIIGHPSELPTLRELDSVNPGKSQTMIPQHLQQLVDAGIVEEVLLSENRRQNDLPYKFYGINESSRQFFEEHKLLRAQDTLREIHDRVEKTDNINRYETAP